MLKNSSGKAVRCEIVNPNAPFSLSMVILILKREVSLKGQTGYTLVIFSMSLTMYPTKRHPLNANLR